MSANEAAQRFGSTTEKLQAAESPSLRPAWPIFTTAPVARPVSLERGEGGGGSRTQDSSAHSDPARETLISALANVAG